MIKAKGSSWDGASDGTSNVYADVCSNTIVAYTADGAIVEKTGLVILSKTSAAAMTLSIPIAGVDNGKKLRIISTTAYAHVVSCQAHRTSPSQGLRVIRLTLKRTMASGGLAQQLRLPDLIPQLPPMPAQPLSPRCPMALSKGSTLWGQIQRGQRIQVPALEAEIIHLSR